MCIPSNLDTVVDSRKWSRIMSQNKIIYRTKTKQNITVSYNYIEETNKISVIHLPL